MRLARRIFFDLFGVIVFISIFGSVAGAILISRSLRAEAFARVRNDLKAARQVLDDQLLHLSAAAELLVSGNIEGLELPTKPDLMLLYKPGKTAVWSKGVYGGYADRESSGPGPLYTYLVEKEHLTFSKGERGFVAITLPALGFLLLGVFYLSKRIVEPVAMLADASKRLEKGTLKYRPETIDVRRSVVEPVVKRLKNSLDHKGMEVRWDWTENAVIKVDRELMGVCLSNLVINAIKYGCDWIELSARRLDEGRVFGVRNGGPAIPADKISLLFKKYSRLVKFDDGAGLGLYLARRIVHRHGGEVWCGSSEEKGTGFFLKLPDRDPSKAPEGASGTSGQKGV